MPRFTSYNQPSRRRASQRRPISAFPPVYMAMLDEILSGNDKASRDCGSDRAAHSTRHDYYRFTAALRDSDDDAAYGIYKQLVTQLMAQLDGQTMTIIVRPFCDVAALRDSFKQRADKINEDYAARFAAAGHLIRENDDDQR